MKSIHRWQTRSVYVFVMPCFFGFFLFSFSCYFFVFVLLRLVMFSLIDRLRRKPADQPCASVLTVVMVSYYPMVIYA